MTDPQLATQWFSFPAFDPVAISIGPLAIRWYALSYMVGLLGGWQILRQLAKRADSPLSVLQLDGLLNWVLFGTIIGGRLGYVFFYKPADYLSDPLSIFYIWQGGMAFHGGFLGVVLAVFLYARRHKIPVLPLGDYVALVAPLGLLCGRLANFINGELFGRVTSHPIGMVFPNGGPLPRHPSQLYEAGLEGLVLGCVMIIAWRIGLPKRYPGIGIALFLTGYGLARFIAEFTRQPDHFLGLYDVAGILSISHGQLLSLPMILAGLWLGAAVIKQNNAPAAASHDKK
ncbi:MAG: prolipoprotein diacylglyceryl transferase [Candidatus Puniceispirillaceae bacterium]